MAQAGALSILGDNDDGRGLPKPRSLTRRERKEAQLFSFNSPRNNRQVTVTDLSYLALALSLEFNPLVRGYVERPCRIALPDVPGLLEATFLVEYLAGGRCYYFVDQPWNFRHFQGPQSAMSHRETTVDANLHRIDLIYADGNEQLGGHFPWPTALRLIPYVWSYRQLASRTLIRRHIEALACARLRITLAEILRAVEYPQASVLAVLARMTHEGSLRLVYPCHTQSMADRRRASGAVKHYQWKSLSPDFSSAV